MRITTTQLKDYQANAEGTEMGNVEDFLFRRGDWTIHYLLIRTEQSFGNRHALISRAAVSDVDYENKTIRLSLAAEQIESSPEINPEEPLARQEVQQLDEHYGWPPEWLDDEEQEILKNGTEGESEESGTLPDAECEIPANQNFNEIAGYFDVQAEDADVGTMQDFITETESWTIEYVLVALAQQDKTVLIPTEHIDKIDWIDGHIYVDMPADTIVNGPAYQPEQPLSEEFAVELADYYS